MSYILEALKKSQQERELGQVPTLETVPVPFDEKVAKPSRWGRAAVVLATLAVLIALYAALRGTPIETKAEPPAMELQTLAPMAATPSRIQDAGDGLVAPNMPVSQPTTSPAPTAVPAPTVISAPTPPPDDAVPVTPAQPSAQRTSGPDQERETTEVQTPERRAAPLWAGQSQVPDDLRRDIEAFKREIRGERPPAKKEPVSAPEPRPQELRLPRDVALRLPVFLMTVHIYDEDPTKRFVYINARKVREGMTTREGIAVEQVLPDGVVLGFEGHKFFRHR